MTSLVERAITYSFTLNSGLFSGTSSNTVTESGLRSQVIMQNNGMNTGSNVTAWIYGMSASLMNQLCQYQIAYTAVATNEMTITAGDNANGMATIFSGGIFEAFVDYSNAPEVAFVVNGFDNLLPNAIPISGTSFSGSVSVATIMRTIANKANLKFSNNGVNVTLTDPVFPGTAGDQMERCADAARIFYAIDKGTLYIWPTEGSRGSDVEAVFSSATGMIGYPSYSAAGVKIQSLFNAKVGCGSKIQISSPYLPQAFVANATGEWIVNNVQHQISAQIQNGPWFTTIEARTASTASQVKS